MDIQKKRVSSMSIPTRSKQSSVSKKSLSVPCSKCLFCQQQGISKDSSYFPFMINKALFTKYSSSQNYYYTRGLNEFLANARTHNVIRFKDTLHYDEDEEYLKRFYMFSEYDGKIRMLTEYYKFHQDIARMFMLPLTSVVNRYHDRKRRLEYFRVTKMLREQNQGKTSPQEKESTKPDKQRHIPLTDRVLDDLDLTQPERKGLEKGAVTERTGSNRQGEGFYNEMSAGLRNANKGKTSQGQRVGKDTRGVPAGKPNPKTGDKAIAMDQSRDLSVSHTIHELNLKLGEIISTSYSQNMNQDALSYFENSEHHQNDTISNLNNFLDYIQVNQQAMKFSKIPAIGSAKPSLHDVKSMPNTCRSPDQELRQSSKTGSKNSDQFMKGAKIAAQKQMSKETNLAEDLLKKVSTEQLTRNFQRSGQSDDRLKNLQSERPTTSLASSKGIGYTTSAATTARANNIPPNSIRIQNFDEALRIRQQTSPPKIDSQRSTSREGHAFNQPRPPSSSLSHRAYDAKALKTSQEVKPREILTSRRSSQTTMTSEANTKSNTKNKSIFTNKGYNNPSDKNMEPSVYTSQNLNSSRPNSHRDMRISLDIQALGRHMSQPGGFSNPSTATYTGKTTSKVPNSAQLKIQSGTMTNFHEKSKSMKMSSGPGNSSAKESKFLNNFGSQLEMRDKDLKSNGSSLSSKKGMVRSQLTNRGEYCSSSNMGIIPEQEIMNMKYNVDDVQRKALTHRESNTLVHHKYTKSEGKFAKMDSMALSKKSSLPQSAIFKDAEQAIYEDRRQMKEKESPSKQIYTYNHNNIVNIFVNPQGEKMTSEPNMVTKGDSKRSGLKFEKDLSSSATLNLGNNKMAPTEVLIKYNNQNPTRKTEMFDPGNKYVHERESPPAVMKREEPRLTKSKSNHGSSIAAPTTNYPKSSLQNKVKGKIELDLMEKKIRVSEDDDYEILLKFKGKK